MQDNKRKEQTSIKLSPSVMIGHESSFNQLKLIEKTVNETRKRFTDNNHRSPKIKVDQVHNLEEADSIQLENAIRLSLPTAH